MQPDTYANALRWRQLVRVATFDPWANDAPWQEWLILGQIFQESSGDPLARSSVGALGLMQLMPYTAREVGISCPRDGYSWADVQMIRERHIDPMAMSDDPRVPEVLRPATNIAGGVRYMRSLFDRIKQEGTWTGSAYQTWLLALSAYNAGMVTVLHALNHARPKTWNEAMPLLDAYADVAQGHKPRELQDRTVREYVERIVGHADKIMPLLEVGA